MIYNYLIIFSIKETKLLVKIAPFWLKPKYTIIIPKTDSMQSDWNKISISNNTVWYPNIHIFKQIYSSCLWRLN